MNGLLLPPEEEEVEEEEDPSAGAAAAGGAILPIFHTSTRARADVRSCTPSRLAIPYSGSSPFLLASPRALHAAREPAPSALAGSGAPSGEALAVRRDLVHLKR